MTVPKPTGEASARKAKEAAARGDAHGVEIANATSTAAAGEKTEAEKLLAGGEVWVLPDPDGGGKTITTKKRRKAMLGARYSASKCHSCAVDQCWAVCTQ